MGVEAVEEVKGPENECGQQSPHQVGRAGPGRSKSLHLLGQCRRQARWYRRRCKSKNRQGTSSVCATKEHLEFKGTVSEDQSSTVQHQRQVSLAVWVRELEDNSGNHQESSDFH